MWQLPEDLATPTQSPPSSPQTVRGARHTRWSEEFLPHLRGPGEKPVVPSAPAPWHMWASSHRSLYSSHLLSLVDNFQGPKWTPETGDSTVPYTCYLFFYAYIPVNLQKHCMTSLWHIHISGITTLMLWSHSQVK